MEHHQDIQALWDTAVAAYETETERKLVTDRTIRAITTVDGLIDLIELQSAKFFGWRRRHAKLTARLTTCLRPVAMLGDIAKGVLSHTPYGPASSAIFGAVLHLIKAADAVSEAYDWVEQALGQLQDLPDRLNLYYKNDIDSVLEKKVSKVMTSLLKVIGRCEALITRGRFRHYLRVVFLIKDEKTRKILDDLNESLEKETSYVVAALFASSKTTERVIKTVAQTTAETQKGVEGQGYLLEESRTREITKDEGDLVQRSLELPAADRTLELFADFRSELLPGTGKWLCKEALFTAWTAQKIPILWVFGGPGSGKTHLSTCIIDHLHGLYGGGQLQSGGVSIAYFYIRENEQQLTDPNTILKTLAWQIAEYDSRFKKHAVKVCSSKQRIISAEQTWNNLFVAFYQSIANIDRSSMLVIDGLDEAPRAARSTLLGFFKRLLSENDDGKQPRIQVAVIGRITLKGDMDFEREEKFIEVSREKNNEDLDRYIEDRLSRIKFMRRLVELDKQEAKKGLQKQTRLRTSKAKDKLKERISKYVDGVFLWAKLLLDQIHHKDGPEIEKILNRPPQTLKGMVKQVYERLSAEEDDLEPIKKLLIWVAYAQRPLLFGEIELILSLPSRAQNILLWEKFQGRLASIFAMKIPEHDVSDENDALEQSRDSGKQVPSEDDEFGTQEEENLRGPSPQAGNSNTEGRNDDLDELGLSSEGDFDGNDHQSDTGEFKLLDDLEIDRGLDVLAAGEHLHAYADWQSKTRITFSHLQFKEFIVHRDQRDPIDLDINVGRSHLEITLTCFEMLQIGFDVQEPSRYLVDYPRRFLTRHLELIDPNAVNENDRYNILQGLYWIFHEERRARSLFNAPTAPGTEEPWEDYWETWLATNTHSKNVRVWLSAGVEMGQRFDEAALTWMKAASMSTKTLFQAWIEALAKMWLVKPGFDDPSYLYKQPNLVWLMYGMASVDEHGMIEPALEDTFYERDYRTLSADRLRELADYAFDEMSPHWHTGLAWVYMQARHHDDAIHHFNEALTLTPDARAAKVGLALIYGYQKRYAEAIKLMEEALSLLPESLTFYDGFLIPQIAEWKEFVGDYQGAYEAAYQGFNAAPRNVLAQESYLKALDKEGSYTLFMKVLSDMQQQTWPDSPVSDLESFLTLDFRIFDEMGRAYRAQGGPQFVLDEMEKALNTVLPPKDIGTKFRLQGEIGMFRYQYNDDVGGSIRLLEQALKTLANARPKTQQENAFHGHRYGRLLARLLFDAGVSARENGRNAWPYAKRLKQLATVTSNANEDFADFFDFYGPGYALLLWGCWLRTYERAPEDMWKKAFKARILDELNMLDDEDPSNDMAGLHSLAITLLHLGDDEAAGAILAVLFMPLKAFRETIQEDDTSSDHESSDNESHEGDDVDNEDKSDGARNETGDDNDGQGRAKVEGEGLVGGANSNAERRAHDGDGTGQGLNLSPQIMRLAVQAGPNSNDIATSDNNPPPPLLRRKTDHVEAVTINNKTRLALALDTLWIHECNGPCSTTFREYTSLYICRICLGTKFCGECLQLVKEERLVRRDCSPGHTWYQAWPIPEGKAEVAAERDGNRWIIRKEWLDELREEWL